MASSHSFSFAGGEELSKIGATWFIVYAYSVKIDSSEKRWLKIKTHSTRISRYNRTRQYHQDWYNEIIKMNHNNLNKNTLEISADETMVMAYSLIQMIEKN